MSKRTRLEDYKTALAELSRLRIGHVVLTEGQRYNILIAYYSILQLHEKKRARRPGREMTPAEAKVRTYNMYLM